MQSAFLLLPLKQLSFGKVFYSLAHILLPARTIWSVSVATYCLYCYWTGWIPDLYARLRFHHEGYKLWDSIIDICAVRSSGSNIDRPSAAWFFHNSSVDNVKSQSCTE